MKDPMDGAAGTNPRASRRSEGASPDGPIRRAELSPGSRRLGRAPLDGRDDQDLVGGGVEGAGGAGLAGPFEAEGQAPRGQILGECRGRLGNRLGSSSIPFGQAEVAVA